ncbi:MAG: hypothetical protein V4475_07055 [Pseudomonadota bacterium]
MSDEPDKSRLDLTANGVEFAAWTTEVENDDLILGRVSFDLGSLLTSLADGTSLGLPPADPPQLKPLEATFVSVEKRAIYRFAFSGVIAFRVLDENGLTAFAQASSKTPPPANTTFRARGHKWADESVLVFLADEGDAPRYSYFVMTSDTCLEVVCYDEPSVTDLGPAVVSTR